MRTPIGRFGGALSSLTAPELGGKAAAEAISRAGVRPEEIGETIFGCARQAGVGPNPGRQVSRLAGVPDSVPAFTVNQACASGMKAVLLAAQAVLLGEADTLLAGGTESMSRVPYLLPGARFGMRMGRQELVDGMFRDGFFCPLCGELMGETAEALARDYGIGRQEQDRFAAESQRRCQEARDQGLFRDEIAPVEVPGPRGIVLVEADEHPRVGITEASLAKLPPVFAPEGSVTAGSSSGITDGAAALIVSSSPGSAADRGPVVRLSAWASAGVDPRRMGIGPVPAVRRLLQRASLSIDQIDVVEINEAFAAQVLACQRELRIDPSRLNPRGGAIALGHPIGCSGARLLVTLSHEMTRRDARYGIASLCVSGGMGVAALLERAASDRRPGDA
ncbi:MAG TPA: thiolase family protein [Candidatus Polarisedimenticolia bacterium]|nr:thiolase family protein [Candidatus Polarisedimenticolia bacterium]